MDLPEEIFSGGPSLMESLLPNTQKAGIAKVGMESVPIITSSPE